MYQFTSEPYTSVFGCGCGFGFEQKFWRIDGFGEKRHGSADLHTPIHPLLSLLSSLPEHKHSSLTIRSLAHQIHVQNIWSTSWERQTNIGRVLSFFVRLIWLGIVCQWLNCYWLGWSNQGILHSPKQTGWEESNKQNMFSSVKHETYLQKAYLTNQAKNGHLLAAQILKR